MSKVVEAYKQLVEYYKEQAAKGFEVALETPGKSGCTQEEINELESELGYSIHKELKDFMLFDYPDKGTLSIWFLGMEAFEDEKFSAGYETELYPFPDGMISMLKSCLEVKEQFEEDIEDGLFAPEDSRLKHGYFNNKWIPIGSNILSNCLFIDLDPSNKGKIGQIILGPGEDSSAQVISDSLADFFAFILDCHQSGKDWIDTAYDNFEESEFYIEEDEGDYDCEPEMSLEEEQKILAQISSNIGISINDLIFLTEEDEDIMNIPIDTFIRRGNIILKANLESYIDENTPAISLALEPFAFPLDSMDFTRKGTKELLHIFISVSDKVIPILKKSDPVIQHFAQIIVSVCCKSCFFAGRFNEVLDFIGYVDEPTKKIVGYNLDKQKAIDASVKEKIKQLL
ncbi:SMI1/KNR4 family protein [Spartinivicinus poritis]|uniref:SMI1/KNR4 family protein n=1 Tax=Spartinivicinus poritis TaxID=2994640 RepID=A0ABT5UDS4_9GAMM|nr:SMI1/KNR4 family protein [Spartinivicinus sp. A2-2]MDE1464529.1 SMI1/KNR4 family protein [Spartinivicinus sp. A2-2]